MARKHLSFSFASVSALLVALAFFAAGPARANNHHNNVSISTDDNHDITSCSQVKIDFDHDSTARGEQQFTLAKKDVSRLTMHLESGSAISGLKSATSLACSCAVLMRMR